MGRRSPFDITDPDCGCGPLGNLPGDGDGGGPHTHEISDIIGLPEALAALQESIDELMAEGGGSGGAVRVDPIQTGFNGVTATFPLTINGIPVPVNTILLVSLNGVMQHHGGSYTISSAPLNITFNTAPESGWHCQIFAFGIGLGDGDGGEGPGNPLTCKPLFSQPAAPTAQDNPCANSIWFSTTNGKLYRWEVNQWVPFAQEAVPGIETVDVLPETGNWDGRIVYLTTTGELFIWRNGGWMAFQNYLTPVTPVGIEVFPSNPVVGNFEGRIIFNTTTNQLMKYVGGVWVQVVEPSTIAEEVADASITVAKFANGIRPVEIVAVLPFEDNFAGRMCFNTTDGKLYRYTGTIWTAATAADDITGTLTTSQIGATTIQTGHLMADAVTADKLAANSVVAGKIAAGAISADEIAANAINADKIAAGAITAEKIAANSIGTNKLQAGSITSEQISANAITVGKIAAGVIGATHLQANAVSADKIAAGAVTAAKVAAGAISAANIQAGAIHSGHIVAGSITADRLYTPSIVLGTLNLTEESVTATRTAIGGSGGFFYTNQWIGVVGLVFPCTWGSRRTVLMSMGFADVGPGGRNLNPLVPFAGALRCMCNGVMIGPQTDTYCQPASATQLTFTALDTYNFSGPTYFELQALASNPDISKIVSTRTPTLTILEHRR